MQPSIDVGGGVHLTGSGAAWIPAERTVVVADLHVGYELAAQRRGGWLPAVASGGEVGARLAALCVEIGATRLVVAGDLRHGTRDVDRFEREELAAFAAAVTPLVALHVVLGNHDRGGALIDVASSVSLRVGDVDVVHHPPTDRPDRWTVCGHLHPRITLRDETGAAARYPCALVGERTIVLPAFSEWAGGTEASRLLSELPPGTWRVLPIAGGSVADLGIALTSPTHE